MRQWGVNESGNHDEIFNLLVHRNKSDGLSRFFDPFRTTIPNS